MIKLELLIGGDKRVEGLVPDEQGYYRIDLSWRYIIDDPPLDTTLTAAGLRYVRRVPNTMYELWELIATYSYNVDGELRLATVRHIPIDFTAPTF